MTDDAMKLAESLIDQRDTARAERDAALAESAQLVEALKVVERFRVQALTDADDAQARVATLTEGLERIKRHGTAQCGAAQSAAATLDAALSPAEPEGEGSAPCGYTLTYGPDHSRCTKPAGHLDSHHDANDGKTWTDAKHGWPGHTTEPQEGTADV